MLHGPTEHALDSDLGKVGMDLRERTEGLDDHQWDDPGGHLMAQLLGEVEDQQSLTNPRERNLERLGDSLAGVARIIDERLVAERLLEHVQRDAEAVGEHRVQQVSTRRIRARLDQRWYQLDLRLLGGTPAPLAVDDLVVALLLGRLDEDRVVKPARGHRVREPFELLLIELLARVVLRDHDVAHRDVTQRVGALLGLRCGLVGLGHGWHFVLHLVSQAHRGGGPCATPRHARRACHNWGAKGPAARCRHAPLLYRADASA